MLQEEDIAIELKCQQYVCKSYMRDQEEKQSVLLFESKQETKERHACVVWHGARTDVSEPPIRMYTMRQEVYRGCSVAASGDKSHRTGGAVDSGDAAIQGVDPVDPEADRYPLGNDPESAPGDHGKHIGAA